MKTIKLTLLSLLLGLLLAPLASAQNITLQWDASPESAVSGYKIHYQAVSSATPFSGNDALEGASPIDIGGATSTTLNGLRDDVVYYFAVTAYDDAGAESSYSTVVASAIPTAPPAPGQWLPELYYPDNGLAAAPMPVQFNWSEPAITTGVTYTLYYGTDPNLDPGSLASAPLTAAPGMAPLTAGICLFGLFGAAFTRSRTFRGMAVMVLFATTLLINGCGGGGDGTETPLTVPGTIVDTTNPPTDTTNPPTDAPAVYTVVVSDLGDNYYDAYDLEPETTYYWKVVVDDGVNRVESQRYSFTTDAL